MNMGKACRTVALMLALAAATAGAQALGQSDAQLKQRIIRQSIASYPGSCPCPYSVDRAGRRCGARSAYSRPGGHAPLCFPGDVSTAMVREARGR